MRTHREREREIPSLPIPISYLLLIKVVNELTARVCTVFRPFEETTVIKSVLALSSGSYQNYIFINAIRKHFFSSTVGRFGGKCLKTN